MEETEKLNESFETEVPMAESDSRVFFFTEIQRRIIYGILRRMYAIMAEGVCEMLTMVQSQALSSIAMVQKYLGHLLFNQRQEKELVLFNQEDVDRFKLPNLKQLLAQELHKNRVVRTAHFHSP